MKNNGYIYKKEKKILWIAILFGFLGGVISNILVSSCFVLIDVESKIGRMGILAITIISFSLFVWFVYHINKNLKKLGIKK